jgi:hypothetical protein
MSVTRLACLSLLTIAAAIQTAHAESPTPLQPVDVVATRYDARAACPGIEAQLQAALGRVAWLEGREALVEVQFAIDGEHVRALDARGGDYDLRVATRQAIGRLDCGAPSGRQQVRVAVQFNAPQSGGPVAMLVE